MLRRSTFPAWQYGRTFSSIFLLSVFGLGIMCPAAALGQGLEWRRGAASPVAESRPALQQPEGVGATGRTASATQLAEYQEPVRRWPASRSAAKRPVAKQPVARRPLLRSRSADQQNVSRVDETQSAVATNGEADFLTAFRRAQRNERPRRRARQVQFAEAIPPPPTSSAPAIVSDGAVVEGHVHAEHSGVVVGGCECGDPGCGIGDGECFCGDVGCGGACGDEVGCCGTCGVGGCFGNCVDRGAIPVTVYVPPLKHLTLFSGVQGFKNPLDTNPTQRDAGNFGFTQGVNVSGRMSWLPWPDIGYQLGYSVTQNQLSGDSISGADAHAQQFFTGGLFRRRSIGWQYGVVYDLLRDERQENVDFGQIRGLISYTSHYGNEWGFEYTASTNDELIGDSLFEAADQFRLFYRRRGRTGGEFRAFIGGDDDNHVILGSELLAPLTPSWSVQTGFTYFVPTDGGDGLAGGVPAASSSATEEAWNLGINLVWHFRGRGPQWYKSRWRPLFNVADNGSLVIDDID